MSSATSATCELSIAWREMPVLQDRRAGVSDGRGSAGRSHRRARPETSKRRSVRGTQTHLLQSKLAWVTRSFMPSRIFLSREPWRRRASNIVEAGEVTKGYWVDEEAGARVVLLIRSNAYRSMDLWIYRSVDRIEQQGSVTRQADRALSGRLAPGDAGLSPPPPAAAGRQARGVRAELRVRTRLRARW